VTPTTTAPTASGSAYGRSAGTCRSSPASGCAMVAAPNAPVKTPTSVMPIWTVARKRLGDSASSSARRALASPSAALTRRRDFLAETTAISDMANTPFARMRSRMSAREIVNTGRRSRAKGGRVPTAAPRGGRGRAARQSITGM